MVLRNSGIYFTLIKIEAKNEKYVLYIIKKPSENQNYLIEMLKKRYIYLSEKKSSTLMYKKLTIFP